VLKKEPEGLKGKIIARIKLPIPIIINMFSFSRFLHIIWILAKIRKNKPTKNNPPIIPFSLKNSKR
jgi:hypothetical protein